MEITLKERLTAYTRVVGIFLPTKYVWRPFGGLLECDRCQVDGRIVTNSQSSISGHLGHSMKQPVLLSVVEMILIWVRWIR